MAVSIMAALKLSRRQLSENEHSLVLIVSVME